VSGKFILVGYSGHGYVVADAAICAGMPLGYYCELSPNNANPFQLHYLGSEAAEGFSGWEGENRFLLGIGDNTVRTKVGLSIFAKKQSMPNVIHPASSLSSYCLMGMGNFISRQTSINALVTIGNFCILNTGCIIEHECRIGDGVHIGPGAVLAGDVKVGDMSFIGANTVIKQGVYVGSNVIIGAGAVIIRDVPDHTKVVGNPGRIL
jgi:sugar O-acyltransferase (sialic acid O-acetyltransferase NeuD family)